MQEPLNPPSQRVGFRRRAMVGWLILLGMGVALSLNGCRPGTNLPPRAMVQGTVRLNGQPLPRGELMFVPEASLGQGGPSAANPNTANPSVANPSASGIIDAQGHYQLTTDHGGGKADGAIIGAHRVRIQARTSSEPGAPSESLIPLRYNQLETSDLRFEVVPGKVNTIDIDLTAP